MILCTSCQRRTIVSVSIPGPASPRVIGRSGSSAIKNCVSGGGPSHAGAAASTGAVRPGAAAPAINFGRTMRTRPHDALELAEHASDGLGRAAGLEHVPGGVVGRQAPDPPLLAAAGLHQPPVGLVGADDVGAALERLAANVFRGVTLVDHARSA